MVMTRAFHASVNDSHWDSESPAYAEIRTGAGDASGPQIAHSRHETPANVGRGPDTTPRSSNGQDTRLSREQSEFDPPSGYLTEKRCSTCTETLPLDAFNRDRSRSDGRQRICRECYRTKIHRSESNKQRSRERSLAYTRDNPEKRRATRKLNYQIESGKMVRGFCECCGNEKADAHHWKGYDKPLDVQWLCRACHVAIEPRRGAA